MKLIRTRTTSRHTIPSGDFSQVVRARFNRPLLRFPVYGQESKFRAITLKPFKIVQKRPVDVAAHVYSVRQAFPYAGKSLVDILYATGIVFRTDTVFGNVDGNLRLRIRISDCLFECFGPEFIAHLRKLDTGFRRKVAAPSHSAS